MKLLDLERSVARRLRELEYPAYMCCMCAILSELRERYRNTFSEERLSLSFRTVELARRALGPAGLNGGQSLELARAWCRMLDQPEEDGPDGWFAVTFTFLAFASELAGEMNPYAATEYVTDAAVKIPVPEKVGFDLRLVGIDLGQRHVEVDLDGEADEASAGVRLLRRLDEAARMSAERAGDRAAWDPDGLRAAVFG